MLEEKFGLEDEAYWTDAWANRRAIQSPLMLAGREGFLIGAPKVVALDKHRSAPLAILRVRKAQGGSPVDFRASAVLAAWDHDQGRLRARLAFPKPPPSPVPRQGAAPSAAKGDSFSGDATAMISEASTLDLASRLQLLPGSGEYTVSLLCLDQAANRCRVRFIDSAAFQDAEAEAYLRALRAEEQGPPRTDPEPGRNSVAYTPQPQSPPIPAEGGIALDVQRVTVMRPDRQCLLHGSFRLPVAASSKPAPSGPDHAATAIVPIGLLLTGSVRPEPIVINLNAPSYRPLEAAEGGTWAVGHFALDLGAFAHLHGAVQTYFVYAFSGDAMAGPVLAAFVNPVLTFATPEEFARRQAHPAAVGAVHGNGAGL
jgi:hypothetical protein